MMYKVMFETMNVVIHYQIEDTDKWEQKYMMAICNLSAKSKFNDVISFQHLFNFYPAGD